MAGERWEDFKGKVYEGTAHSAATLPRPDGHFREELDQRLHAPQHPHLVGAGPSEFATTMALELHPSLIWDTNLYYADLGVDVHATRKQIKARYQELHGERSPRLTMIAEVLLNVERRRKYDMTPLGSHFYDTYIEEGVRRRLTEAVSERLANGENLDDILAEDDDKFEDAIAEAEALSLESQARVDRALGRHKWSYYLWQSTCNDTARLAEWRTRLVTWLWYYRLEVGPISVGFMDTGEDVAVRKVGSRIVVFLSDALDPTDVLSCMAVAELRSHLTPESTEPIGA